MKIADLPYLEECLDIVCEGGFVYAETYTIAGPGFANADAFALAVGEFAFTKTRTVTRVHRLRNITISHARAFSKAIAVTEIGIERDRSFSLSFYIYRG